MAKEREHRQKTFFLNIVSNVLKVRRTETGDRVVRKTVKVKEKKKKPKKARKTNPVRKYFKFRSAVRANLYGLGLTETTTTTEGGVQIRHTDDTGVTYTSNIGKPGGQGVSTQVTGKNPVPPYDSDVARGEWIIRNQAGKKRKKDAPRTKVQTGDFVGPSPLELQYGTVNPENLKKLKDSLGQVNAHGRKTKLRRRYGG